MKTLKADKRYPNTGGWQDRHNLAVRLPVTFEDSLLDMLKAWELYAKQHWARYDSKIGEDGYLGEVWLDMGKRIRDLLNGDTGRLDCGTLDTFILETIEYSGFDLEEEGL